MQLTPGVPVDVSAFTPVKTLIVRGNYGACPYTFQHRALLSGVWHTLWSTTHLNDSRSVVVVTNEIQVIVGTGEGLNVGTASVVVQDISGAVGPTGATGATGPAGPGSVWVFGAASVAIAADTRYLPRGTTATAPTTSDFAFRVSRAGTARNLRVRHNAAAGNGQNITYTLRVNGLDTALTCTLATGAVGDANDLVNSVAVAAGDLIELVAVKGASIGAGGVNVAASVAFD